MEEHGELPKEEDGVADDYIRIIDAQIRYNNERDIFFECYFNDNFRRNYPDKHVVLHYVHTSGSYERLDENTGETLNIYEEYCEAQELWFEEQDKVDYMENVFKGSHPDDYRICKVHAMQVEQELRENGEGIRCKRCKNKFKTRHELNAHLRRKRLCDERTLEEKEAYDSLTPIERKRLAQKKYSQSEKGKEKTKKEIESGYYRDYSRKYRNTEEMNKVIDCGCGSKYQRKSQSSHFKTIRHSKWLEQEKEKVQEKPANVEVPEAEIDQLNKEFHDLRH